MLVVIVTVVTTVVVFLVLRIKEGYKDVMSACNGYMHSSTAVITFLVKSKVKFIDKDRRPFSRMLFLKYSNLFLLMLTNWHKRRDRNKGKQSAD